MNSINNLDGRIRKNKSYAKYPKSLIGVTPELRQIILDDALHGEGPNKIQWHVNDILIPEYVRLRTTVNSVAGRHVSMAEIVDTITGLELWVP